MASSGIAVTGLEDSDDLQAETVGQAMPGMEIKIVDDERRELPPGQVGDQYPAGSCLAD